MEVFNFRIIKNSDHVQTTIESGHLQSVDGILCVAFSFPISTELSALFYCTQQDLRNVNSD